ncbi:putative Adenylate cyclase [Burkholderiales bacterium]|nr:putative Adenylate cyclase [Burkholderiales bacterium]
MPGTAPAQFQAMDEREVELKLRLRAQDLAALRSRLDALGAAARTERVDSVYYDTPDLRLASGKAALRLRSIGEGRTRRWLQTFKTQDSAAALSVRGEWERPAPGGRIDLRSLADSPLAQMLDGAPRAPRPRATGELLASLRPVFRTVFDRCAWDLALEGAHIEAVIDAGEIQAGGRSEPICEAELELRAGPHSAILDLALALAGATGRRHADLSLLPYGESKAARGYRLALGRGPMPFAAGFSRLPQAFTPQQRVAGAARQLVALGMTALLANAAEFADSANPEFVHQARVAIRRMRAGLDLLGAQAEVPPALLHSLRTWAGRFGAVRDWDVLCTEQLPPLAAAASGGSAASWTRVCELAAKRRNGARTRLGRQLAEPAFAEFALRALRWSAGVPARPGKRLADFARKAVRARQRRLAVAARSFARLPAERQHKIRIQAKGLRYGIEMLQASLPKRIRRGALLGLTRFQDAAGSARDALLVQLAVARLTRSAAIRRQVQQWAQSRQSTAIGKAQRLAAYLKPAR